MAEGEHFGKQELKQLKEGWAQGQASQGSVPRGGAPSPPPPAQPASHLTTFPAHLESFPWPSLALPGPPWCPASL